MPAILIGGARIQILPDMSGFRRELQQHNSKIVGAMMSIGKTGAAAIGVGLSAAIGVGVKTAADLEQANVAFTTLLGSGKKASDFLSGLKKFAAATPFELPGLVDASRQLIGVGESADKVIPTLRAWGDTSGALGLSQEQFSRTMIALTQSMANGKIQAGDMLQITQAGIPIWSIMAKALGKPVSAVRKMSENGKLLTKDVLPKLEKQMEHDYGGAMVKQSKTLTGLWSTLTDTFKIGMATALQPMIPLLKEGVAGATKFLGKAFAELPVIAKRAGPVLSEIGTFVQTSVIPAIRRVAEVVGPTLKTIITTIISFGRALITQVGPPLIAFGKAVASILLPIGAIVIKALGPAFATVGSILKATLIPAMAALLKAGTAVINWVKSMGLWLAPLGVIIGGLTLIVTANRIAIGLTTLAMNAARIAITAWRVATTIATTAWRLLSLAFTASPIGLIITGIIALGVALVVAYKKSETFRAIVKATFDWLIMAGKAIGAWFSGPFVRFFTETIPAGFRWLLNWVKGHWPWILGALTGPIGLAVVWIVKHWQSVVDFFGAAWRAIKRNTVDPIVRFFGTTLPGAAGKAKDAVVGAFRWMVLKVLDAFGSIIRGAAKLFGWVPGVGGKLKSAARSFQKFRDDVNAALGGVKDKPVTVSTKFWASFGGKSVHEVVGAEGGPVPMTKNAKRGKDSVHALVMPDEHIWTVDEVNAVGGHQSMYRMRAAARAGAFRGFQYGGRIPRYATGGEVHVRAHVPSRKQVFNVIDSTILDGVNANARAIYSALLAASGGPALAWARTQIGKPYIWGGVGPRGYDCSGFQSAIENVIRGLNPYHRRWATGAFSGSRAPSGWVRSLRSRYEVGITNAGVGHTAGTLGGVNVESSGGVGVRVGDGARGAHNRMFPAWYGFKALAYDRGGLIYGPGLFAKHTVDPERMLSPRQTAAFEKWMDARPARGEGSGGITIRRVVLENHGVIGSRYEMEDWLVESFSQLQRHGRIRIITQPGQ